MSNSIDTTKTSTLAGWKKNAVHAFVLPSGTVVQVKIPDLPTLLEAGEIPQNLIEHALGSAPQNERPTAESMKREREFRDVLVRATVSEPKLGLDDVRELPSEDKDMLVELAMRQRDMDAEGNHIGGLTKSDTFRAIRRIPSVDAVLAGESGGW